LTIKSGNDGMQEAEKPLIADANEENLLSEAWKERDL
jgi:hypothetical protein